RGARDHDDARPRPPASIWNSKTNHNVSEERRSDRETRDCPRSVVVIIANIFEAEPYQMSFVQRDHVIQHLTAYAPHPSFRDSVLPRTANACPDSFDPARFQKAEHLGTELAVTIKDDVAVWAWKRQVLSELL